MEKTQAQPVDKSPRRSRLRWLRRPIVWIATLVLLVASIVIAIHLILRSDLPRQIVVSQAEQMTGLRVEIDQLRSHWDGTTNIQGLRVGLPLAGDDLLSVHSIYVKHARPWMLLLGIGIESIEIDQPLVSVRQDAAGRWNLQELASLILTTSDDTGSGPLTNLPAVSIAGASVDLIDNHQRAISLDDISLNGQPTPGAGWTFRLSLDNSGQRTVSGQLVTGGRFTHDLTFAFSDPLKVVEPLVGAELPSSLVKGGWTGTIAEGRLQGTLTLDEASLSTASVKGSLGVDISAVGVKLLPGDLAINHPAIPGGSASISHGVITFDGSVVTLRNLRSNAMGGALKLSGQANPFERSAEVALSFEGLTYAGLTAGGGIQAYLSQTQVGVYEVRADAMLTGSVAQMSWQCNANLNARGSDLSSVAWSAHITAGRVARGTATLDLSDVSAQGTLAWPKLTVTSSAIKSFVTLESSGSVDLSTMAWDLKGKVPDLPLQNPYDDQAMPELHVASFQLEGKGRSFRVTEGRVSGPRMRATFVGGYGDNGMQPLFLNVDGSAEPLRLVLPWGGELRTDESSVQLRLSGALSPTLLAMEGEVAASQVWYGGKSIGRIVIPIDGTLLPSGLMTIVSHDIELLDGQLNMECRADLSNGDMTVLVSGDAIDLERIDALLGEPQQLRGVASIVDFKAEVSSSNLAAIRAGGRLRIDNLSARGLGLGQFESDVRLTREGLNLLDMRLTQGDGSISGESSTAFAEGLPTEVQLKLDAWPLQWPGVDAVATVDGDLAASADFAGLLIASVALDTSLALSGQDMGELRLEAAYEPGRIRLSRLAGVFLKGEVAGSGDIVLDELLRSSGRVTWNDISLPEAVAIVPQLKLIEEYGDLQGRVSGSVTIGASQDRRAKGAAEIRLAVEPKDASMRGVRFSTASATAFLWPSRLVIDSAKLELDRGSISAWGRASKHGDDMDVFVRASLTSLDIAPLLAAVSSDAEPMPGVLSGDVTLHLPPSGMDYADGSANLTITESDLARLGPLTALYNAMNMDLLSSSEPQGEGHLVARIEGGDLYLAEVRYVNRGAHARASGVVRDIRKARESGISVVAIGSWQPLPRVLLLEDVDNAIRSVQQNLAAVRVEGTVAEPKASQLSADNLRRTLRSVLVSESAETSGPSQ